MVGLKAFNLSTYKQPSNSLIIVLGPNSFLVYQQSFIGLVVGCKLKASIS